MRSTALGAAETNNDKLKIGLSVGGLVISALWLVCARDIADDLPALAIHDRVLAWYLPAAFLVGWLVSLIIHFLNWLLALLAARGQRPLSKPKVHARL